MDDHLAHTSPHLRAEFVWLLELMAAEHRPGQRGSLGVPNGVTPLDVHQVSSGQARLANDLLAQQHLGTNLRHVPHIEALENLGHRPWAVAQQLDQRPFACRGQQALLRLAQQEPILQPAWGGLRPDPLRQSFETLGHVGVLCSQVGQRRHPLRADGDLFFAVQGDVAVTA